MAWEHENNLGHDDFWLCAACFWLEIIGTVTRYVLAWIWTYVNSQDPQMNWMIKNEHFSESVIIVPMLVFDTFKSCWHLYGRKVLFGGRYWKTETWKKLNMARGQENTLDHDDLWLCAACLWLEFVGILVTTYAIGRNLKYYKHPRLQNDQDLLRPSNEPNEQIMNFFWKLNYSNTKFFGIHEYRIS